MACLASLQSPSRSPPPAFLDRASIGEWRAPRLELQHGRPREIVFADGAIVRLDTDRLGRVTVVRWPGPRGVTLTTRVEYAATATTIRDPFGIARTCRLTGRGRVDEVDAPGAPNRPNAALVGETLDSFATFAHVQNRLPADTDGLQGALSAAARGTLTGNSQFDNPGDGGYFEVGITALKDAAAVVAVLRRFHILDVSTVYPTASTAAQLNNTSDALGASLGPLYDDCHLSSGESSNAVIADIANGITTAELNALIQFLVRSHVWAIIDSAGASACATPDSLRAPVNRSRFDSRSGRVPWLTAPGHRRHRYSSGPRRFADAPVARR